MYLASILYCQLGVWTVLWPRVLSSCPCATLHGPFGLGSKSEYPERTRKKCMAFLWPTLQSYKVSLSLYSIGCDCHKGLPTRGEGTFPPLDEGSGKELEDHVGWDILRPTLKYIKNKMV